MVTIDEAVFYELQQSAIRRNISIQELFRAIVIPDWIERHVPEESPPPRENQQDTRNDT